IRHFSAIIELQNPSNELIIEWASMIGLKVLYDLILFTVIITMEFFLLLNMYKTSTAISDADDNDIYRIIPYVAPEIFQGKE
ncbi:1346_t:CDS:2, partial [Funneliformis geosporum]